MALPAESQRAREPTAAAPPAEGRSSFLRLLAHELRNHIATINNTLFMLRLQSGKMGSTPVAPLGAAARAGGADEWKPMLDMIERQAAAMTRALDLMVEAERMEQGELTLELEPIDARALVNDAVSATSDLRAERGQQLIVTGFPDPIPMQGDASRLRRAITQVLDNASRYSKPGRSIALTVTSTPEDVWIRVRDEGEGIAPERLSRLFEFLVARHRGAGLGMGLPLARGWVALHGGSMEAESGGSDQGTEITMRLPRVARVSADGSPDEAPNVALTGRPMEAAAATSTARRVLVVDDHASLRASLCEALREMGHVTREAANGAEALAIVEAWRPEFVLLDIHMPGMNGFEIARALRSRYSRASMQLVMMSGDTLDEFVIAGAREAGFDHWVDKAAALGSLQAILRAGARAD
jgi:CheY-like chemotaxis protein/anti-sigma regulatory factor (Ser/Thr protein kinase)